MTLRAVLFDLAGTLYDDATGGAYPDARAALAAVIDMGLRVALVSNSSLDEALERAEVIGVYPELTPILASEEIGVAKPDPEIFRLACEAVDCAPDEVLMVGDDLTSDVLGALGAGLRAVWLNRADDRTAAQALGRSGSPAPTIHTLTRLSPILG